MNPFPKDIKQAIRNRYAWPGGYPMYLIAHDAACLCMDCARKEWRIICHSTLHGMRDGWAISAVDINWEDESLTCDHCGQSIESAYGEQS
jgi:hypothetical protein